MKHVLLADATWPEVAMVLAVAAVPLLAAMAALLRTYTKALERKIDRNTQITEQVAEEAVKAKAAAVVAAKQARGIEEKVEEIRGNINGNLLAVVADMELPVMPPQSVSSKSGLEELSRYIHRRNHDIMDALATLRNESRANQVLIRAACEKLGIPLPQPPESP